MPPKKDEKGKKGAKGGAALKEINPADYVRKAVSLDALPQQIAPLTSKLSGLIKNIESVFPEWTIVGEDWEILPENHEECRILENHNVVKHESVKILLGLDVGEVANTGKKGKAPPKKDPKKHTSVEIIESEVDEHGHRLPRIFLGKEGEAHGDDTASLTGHEFNRSFKTSSNADEVDPYICAAFKVLRQFAPSILTSQSAGGAGDDRSVKGSYLWRSIYPQSASGRPCYNPAGKYCVKLFLGGKWRKITVSDVMPLKEDGTLAIASSSDPMELWPSILAKAVYMVYTACGYDRTLPGIEGGEGASANSTAHKVAFFVGFVLHLLAGWRPGTAWSVNELIVSDPTRVNGILQEVLFGGAVLVPPADIPGDEPRPSFSTPNSPIKAAAGSSEDVEAIRGEDGEIMRTKRQYKEEFRKRLANRQSVVSAIAARETKIETIDNALKKPFSECFIVCIPAPVLSPVTPGKNRKKSKMVVVTETSSVIQVLPILGVSFPEGNDDLGAVNLIVHWEKGDKPAGSGIDISSDALMISAEGDEIKLGKEAFALLDSPLPPSTPVKYTIMSLRELMSKGAMIFGVDTGSKTSHSAALGWHWLPAVPSAVEAGAAKGGKDKGAAAKGGKKKDDKSVSEGPELVEEPGTLPPVLLSIDTSSFFTSPPPLSEEESAIADQKRELTALASNDPDAEYSLAQTPAGAAKLISKSPFLSLSVIIHADMVFPSTAHTADGGSASASAPTTPKTPKTPKNGVHDDADSLSVTSHDAWHGPPLPSSVVVVLQEVRWDAEDPLVMRVELSQHAHIPLTRATFQIPADRVPTGSGGSFVFWVRLFTQASVYLTFGCSEPLSTGAAEELWKRVGAGGHALVREGEAGPTRPFSEQLLFRVPLQLTESVEEDQVAAGSNQALTFLLISEPSIAKTVSMMSLNASSSTSTSGSAYGFDDGQFAPINSYSMPRLEANMISLGSSSIDAKLLLARCFPPDNGAVAVPPFKWKLVVLTRRALAESPPRPINEKPFESRFRGRYTPNNKLVLFRDVITFDKASFPLAFRFTTLPKPSAAPELAAGEAVVDGVDVTEGINLIVRLYRKADRKFVSCYTGRSILPVYDVPVEGFIPDEVETPSTDGKKTPAKKDDKGKGKGGVPAVEPLDVIVECSLDETAMKIPHAWRSRTPFYFDSGVGDASSSANSSSLEGGIIGTSITAAAKPSPDKFHWQLDVLAGTVVNAAHDTFDLERWAAAKNLWEEESSGRTARAGAAAAHFRILSSSSPAVVAGASQGDETDEAGAGAGVAAAQRAEALEQLAVALEKPIGDLQARASLLEGFAEYKEYVHGPHDEEPYFVDDELIAAARSVRDEEETASQANASAAVEKLIAFNASLKDETKARLSGLVEVAKSNGLEILSLWEEREKYRISAQKRNESLKYLLERSTAAIETCADIESGGSGGKKKPGKK